MESIAWPDLIDPELIKKAKNLNSTLLSDAIEKRAGMDSEIKPVSDEWNIAGTAITISLEPTDNLFLHHLIYLSNEGYVIVADGKGSKSSAYMGELMTKAAKAVGLEGIVIDGAVRDKTALIDLGFPLFSRGFVSNGPTKEKEGVINVPITCGGINVSPGDLIVGDADGVVVVPRGDIENVLQKAEDKLEYELKRIEVINEYENNKLMNIEENVKLEPTWLKGKIEKFIANG